MRRGCTTGVSRRDVRDSGCHVAERLKRHAILWGQRKQRTAAVCKRLNCRPGRVVWCSMSDVALVRHKTGAETFLPGFWDFRCTKGREKEKGKYPSNLHR